MSKLSSAATFILKKKKKNVPVSEYVLILPSIQYQGLYSPIIL